MKPRANKALTVALLVVAAMLAVGLLLARRERPFGSDAEAPDVPSATVAPLIERRELAEHRSYLAVRGQRTSTGPLVLVIHGDTGSAESVREYTGFDRVVLAQDPTATVAYLQADGKYWHLGRIESELSYMSQVIADAHASGPVFVFGWSSGANLAQSFACAEPRVKAIALSGGRTAITCDRALRIPTLALHNTGDKAHSIDLGDALVATLRSHRQCSGAEQATLLPPCVRYQGCSAPLAYCRVEGGTHRPWRSAARAAWQFFSEVAHD